MEMTSQLPVAYPFSRDGGFGCRSAFMSPVYCQDTSQLSDSGICISSKVDSSGSGQYVAAPTHEMDTFPIATEIAMYSSI